MYFLQKEFLNGSVKKKCLKGKLTIKEMQTLGSFLNPLFYFGPKHLFHNTSIVKITSVFYQDTMDIQLLSAKENSVQVFHKLQWTT